MITTILLDIGGTIFIKNEVGFGEKNPAILFLNKNLPNTVKVILVSDTDLPDLKHTFTISFPNLKYDALFTRNEYPWLDKTKPETYLKVCKLIDRNPKECVLIDNQDDFRSAAEIAGIKTYGVDQNSIEDCLREIQ